MADNHNNRKQINKNFRRNGAQYKRTPRTQRPNPNTILVNTKSNLKVHKKIILRLEFTELTKISVTGRKMHYSTKWSWKAHPNSVLRCCNTKRNTVIPEIMRENQLYRWSKYVHCRINWYLYYSLAFHPFVNP